MLVVFMKSTLPILRNALRLFIVSSKVKETIRSVACLRLTSQLRFGHTFTSRNTPYNHVNQISNTHHL